MENSDANSDLDFDAVNIGFEHHESKQLDLFPVEDDFYGYELLLLLRFQSDSELFLSWIEKYDKSKNALDFEVVVSYMK
jgi:hypothetical protein